jgi:hypothetical protein
MNKRDEVSRYVGKCIYCGSTTNLSDEHVVPRGLGGEWVLKKASCQKCAGIISRFETDIIKDFFSLLRIKLDLPTRRKKQRPKSFDFLITHGDKEEVVSFPVKTRRAGTHVLARG